MTVNISRRSLLAGALGALAVPTTGGLLPAAAHAESLLAGGLSNEDFTLIAMPDTQMAVAKYQSSLSAQLDWILGSRDNLTWNARFVMHVGDVVHHVDDASQWTFARNQMNRLDNYLPYSIAPGNHDGTGADHRNFDTFNQWFPYSKFDLLPTAGNNFAQVAGRMEHHWHQFTAGGVDWGIISLGYDPSGVTLTWAQEVVAANPDKQFIVNTHSYLLAGNQGVRAGDAALTEQGTRIWNWFVKRYANIVMVVCGHTYHSGPSYTRRVGLNGNTVHEILADYQFNHENKENYDYTEEQARELNSRFRVMKFRPSQNRVYVYTRSARTSSWVSDPVNQFEIANFPFPAGKPRIRRHFGNDIQVFWNWNFTWPDTRILANDQMLKYPVGSVMPAQPVVRRATGTDAVYVIDFGRKRHVRSARSLKAWRLHDSVRDVPASEINAYPTGPAWPDYPFIVRFDQTQQAYMLDTGV